MPWNASRFKLWAIINFFGVPVPFYNTILPTWFTFDVAQFTADFELNTIPKATLLLPLGRRMDDVNQVAFIHKVVNLMKIKLPVQVFMQGLTTAADTPGDTWPVNPDGTPKTFKVFEGTTVGCGYRKSMQGAEFVLFLTHWLEKLNFSSATSRMYQPLNPQQYSFVAALPNFENSGAQAEVGMTMLHNYFNASVVVRDFWGYVGPERIELPPLWPDGPRFRTPKTGGIKPWFIELSAQDMVNAAELTRLAGITSNPIDRKNYEAIGALRKFEPIPNISPNGYLDGVPLDLDVSPEFAVDGWAAAAQISTAIARASYYSLSATTIWDKLVGDLAAQFSFAVVPLIDKALVVPFTPCLRVENPPTIRASEYDSIEMNLAMPRTVRAIALTASTVSVGNSDGTNNTPAQRVNNSIGGWYAPPGRQAGQILIRSLPPWLADIAAPQVISNITVPVQGPIVTVLAPGAPGQPEIVINLTAYLARAKNLWNKYAQAVYVQEVLRGRHGQLSGKLRFDIGPGTQVLIEGSQEPFTDDALGQNFYAAVLRVSMAINAETQRAGTAFHFSHIRDEYENTVDATSVNRHPLWKTKWIGAPLIRA